MEIVIAIAVVLTVTTLAIPVNQLTIIKIVIVLRNLTTTTVLLQVVQTLFKAEY
jgi:hypothetical protein